jgi:hypothetical protein
MNKKALATAFVLLGFAFVVPVEASSELWSQTYGGSSYETAYSVVETSDGGYAIAGGTTSFSNGEYDFWLIKTDQYGSMEWNQTYGGTKDDIAHSVIETSDGGYALAGSTNGTNNIGALGRDFWLIKTDEYGNMQWNKTYGGAEDDYASTLKVTSDGGYVLAGTTDSFGAGNYDFWLIKTDAYGNMEWNQTYGGEGYEDANSLVQTSDGGYVLAGAINSVYASSDWLIIKTDAQGIPEFPSWMLLPLTILATLIAVGVKRRL